MFKVIDDPQWVDDVTVNVPDGTGWQQQILRTRFRALPASDVDALNEAGGATAVLERAVLGFEDLTDEQDKPVEGDGPWREKLLEYAYVRLALIRHYFAAQSGQRLGNLETSAAPGLGVN